MIRKTINSVLLIVFMFSSIGYSLSMHYCGSTRISASVIMQPKSCCGDESGTCCHNEIKHYQIEDSYFVSTQEINEQTKQISDLILVVASSSSLHINDIARTELHFIAESPPPVSLDKYLSSLQTYLL